jgi:hypothetical protein
MHSPDAVDEALGLLAAGMSIGQVSAALEIPRTTIRHWDHGRVAGRPGIRSRRLRDGCFRCAQAHAGSSPDPFPRLTMSAYAYLFGLYLGDGHLATLPRRVFRLSISLDRKYPVIVRETETALSLCLPANRVSVHRRANERMDLVSSHSQHWPCLLPQHDAGPKHLRAIRLERWQRRVLDEHPWRFLRGLIHSDGCRCMNPSIHPTKTYRYPRYTFSNRSHDIRDLFCEYCEKVGVEWRQMNRWNISVARRDSVAAMDRHIGPKR